MPAPRVLIIDDEAAVGLILSRALRPWEAVVAHDGRAALACLSEQLWDAVLCDLSLPDVDGMALYAEASAEQRARFIFMTGGAYTADAQRFLEGCGAPVIYKPFEPASVREVVGELLDPET